MSTYKEELTIYNNTIDSDDDSMLYDSDTNIARYTLIDGDNKFILDLKVTGNVNVEYKNELYFCASDMPAELIELFKNKNAYKLDGTDDLQINANNWYACEYKHIRISDDEWLQHDEFVVDDMPMCTQKGLLNFFRNTVDWIKDDNTVHPCITYLLTGQIESKEHLMSTMRSHNLNVADISNENNWCDMIESIKNNDAVVVNSATIDGIITKIPDRTFVSIYINSDNKESVDKETLPPNLADVVDISKDCPSDELDNILSDYCDIAKQIEKIVKIIKSVKEDLFFNYEEKDGKILVKVYYYSGESHFETIENVAYQCFTDKELMFHVMHCWLKKQSLHQFT